jgi:hypothetical protein
MIVLGIEMHIQQPIKLAVMKNFLIFISALSFLVAGCTEDVIWEEYPTGECRFTFNGEYYEYKNYHFALGFSQSGFQMSVPGRDLTFTIDLLASGVLLEAGTYSILDHPDSFAEITMVNTGTIYRVGKQIGIVKFPGTGKITFTEYDYTHGYVEGTFEFTGDKLAPFTVTNGYFKIKE